MALNPYGDGARDVGGDLSLSSFFRQTDASNFVQLNWINCGAQESSEYLDLEPT